MRLIVDLAKAMGAKIAEEMLLMNDYLRLENSVMLGLLKKHGISSRELEAEVRLKLSQRARKLHPLSRPFCIHIASPKTVVYRWFNKIKNKIYDSSDKQPTKKKRPGRPKIDEQIKEVILKLAREQTGASVRFIANALKMMNFTVSHETVRNILKLEGISPAPERLKNMPWSEFLQKSGMWQMDFTTTHIVAENAQTKKMEAICYHVLFFIEVATRKVVCGGIRENPDGEWMKNVLRSLLSFELESMKYLIMDRDPVFKPIRSMLEVSGVTPVVLPRKSPNLNAYIERFHRSFKDDCLSWLFITQEKQLRNAVTQYLLYYNHERPHQSLGGLPPEPDIMITQAMNAERTGEVKCRTRLNGLLNFYYREAAA